jgi:hypothetical protein
MCEMTPASRVHLGLLRGSLYNFFLHYLPVSPLTWLLVLLLLLLLLLPGCRTVCRELT